MSISCAELSDLVEQAGEEVITGNLRSYSGRGMKGRECAAVVVENPLVAVAALAYVAAENDLPDFLHDVSEAVVDTLGRSQILYFPTIDWTSEEDAGEPETVDAIDEG